ncbi:hypothetical protein ScPMuIL_005079 [Solemya velum]
MASEAGLRQDQTSHKVIEKRRRDRINNCLAELSQTVPSAFAKQNSGKLEKAEILEMTVEYLRVIQGTEIGMRFENGEWFSSDIYTDFVNHYRTGYSECMREILRYMTDIEGMNAGDDRCLRLIAHLQTKYRPDMSLTSASANRRNITGMRADVRDLNSKVLTGNGNSNSTTGLYRYNPYMIPFLPPVTRENTSTPHILGDKKSFASRSPSSSLPMLFGPSLINSTMRTMKSPGTTTPNNFSMVVTQSALASTNTSPVFRP